MGIAPATSRSQYSRARSLLITWLEQQEEQQKNAFRTQIKWALEFEIPIVIHSREAKNEELYKSVIYFFYVLTRA